MEQEELLAQVHGALANPVRVKIIEMLIAQDEVSSGELASAADRRQANTSQHLMYLKRIGMVKSRTGEDGHTVLYSLARPEIKLPLRRFHAVLLKGDE